MRVVVGDLYTENIEKLDLIRGKLSDLTKRNFIEMEDELYKATPLFKKNCDQPPYTSKITVS